MAKGSNELNLLLKSKVVKIKVELDIKGSGLAGQVNKITDFLKDKRVKLKVELQTTGLTAEVTKLNTYLKEKKVKLGVELDYNKTTLNSQIKAINTMIKTGGGLSNIKVALNIDVKGSASQIKKQLADINKDISDFNKNYKKILEDTSKIGKGANKVAPAVVANKDSYAKSLADAKQFMSQQYGKGLFTSVEMKDANGVLTGFIGNLTKANGVVQKIRYDWDANSGKFTPINRQTVTNTEKNADQALKALKNLDREISSLGKNQNSFWQESNALKNSGNITMEAVEALKRRVKEEQKLESQIKEENNLLRQQRELVAQINREQKKAKSTKYRDELGSIKNSVVNVDLNDNMAKNTLKDLKSDLGNVKKNYTDAIAKEKQLKTAVEKRKDVLAEIAVLEKKHQFNSSSGATSKRYIEETKALANNIKTMEQYNKVKARMSATNRGLASLKVDDDIEKQLGKLQKAMYNYAKETGKSLSVIETRYEQVAHAVRNNLASATKEVERFNRLTDNFKIKSAYDQRQASIVQLNADSRLNNAEHKKVKGFVDARDNQALKEYISNLNGAQVAMMRLSTDSKGVSRITAQFASTGKMAKELSYEIDKVDGKLRQIGSRDVFNANRNLGVFEQLKIAMARVPVWMVAMTAFHGSIRTVQNMTEEILKLDKAMTELRRVADSQIDTGFLFEGAVKMSKELGNNIHDVMGSINELARTFGHFNERQLLAITNTATLMSNVSDLSAQEATESLVGTMNAFNITAEDSIRIVDSMNEVDNNYAISTKQLATGLAKSASTAKTFGVTMEESLGHITAIGAVTMESGNIIGNSLKTIYSRITTLKGAEDILSSIGVSIRDMATGDTREVNDILGDLAKKWHTLTDAERQNIGVTVAGRYQLSRFLALMNNYNMATEATTTALTSQGSATRENAQYLKSFEARINALKNSFTELASGIGDAFLSSGLSIGLDMLTSMANGITSVVDKVGVLGVVFGALGLALFKFGALTHVWNFATASVTGLTGAVGGTISGLRLMGTTAVQTFNAVRTGAITAGVAVRTMGSAFTVAFGFMKSAMISTGVLAGFVALGVAIEWIVSKFSKYRAEAKELEETNKKMVQSYRDSGDGMQSMISQYEALEKKKKSSIGLTQDEAVELERLSNEFADKLPTVVDHYDANGKAVLRSTEAIKEQVEVVKELSKEQAKLKDLELAENIKKEAEAYEETAKKIQKSKDKIEELKKPAFVSDEFGVSYEVDNSKKLQDEIINLMKLEAQRREAMSGVTKLIQEQSMAHLEASGNMEGFGDNQRKLIENFVTYNDQILMSASNNGTLEETMVSMTERANQLTSVFTQTYDVMSQGLDTSQLQDLRTQLEAVSASIPEDLLVIDYASSVGGMTKITDAMKEIINVSVHVKQGSTDFDYLSDRLVASGLTADQAREQLGRLADQYSNSAIRAEAMAQSVNGTAESIDTMTESAINAVSPLETLFGYSNEDVSAIKSHIELMEVFYDRYGEGAEKMVDFQASLYELSGYFGVSEEEIKKNLHQYNLLADAMGKVKITMDDTGQSFIDLSELTPKQAEMVNAWLKSAEGIDFFTKKLEENGGRVAGVVEEYSKAKAIADEPWAIADNIDTSGIDRFKKPLDEIVKITADVKQQVGDNFGLISNTVSELSQSASNVENLGSKVKDTGDKADATKQKTQDFAKQANKAFGDVATTATTKSTVIKNQFSSVSSIFDNVVASARNMNTELSRANGAIDNYNRRASSIVRTPVLDTSYGMQSVIPSYNGTSESVAQSVASFSATAEGVASSGGLGGGEGTSGVIQSSLPTMPVFTALHGSSNSKYRIGTGTLPSSSSTVKKASTALKSSNKSVTKTPKTTAKEKAEKEKKKAEELAELYVIDLLDRKRTKYEGTLSQLNAKLSATSENSKEYRYGLSEVMRYEQAIQKINIQDLAVAEKRNKQITKRLGELSNTSKHTVKQREEYNKLQQEYDSNLGKISQLKGEIETTIFELRQKTEEIFMDFVNEIIANIDKGLKAVQDRIDDIDFEMEVLELTDPDNDVAKIELLATKVRDLTKEQEKYNNAQADMEEQLRDANKKFGAQSQAVKDIVKQMEDYEESWENVTLEILRAEKEIRDIRGELADDIIESTKKQYEATRKLAQENAEKTKDIEIENAKKAHDEKMKLYDKESERISELYDQRIKAIDDEYNKDTYEEEVSDRNKEIAKLTEKAKTYSGDTSLEGRKKLAEINEEIAEKQKDLDNFVKKNRIDALKEQLTEEKEMQLEKIESQKKADEEAHDVFMTQLDAERDAISKHYEDTTEDEKKWAKIREELMKGNFSVVKQLLSEMGIDLEQLADGTFNTLSDNFGTYSQEVRNFVLEINSMISQINAMTGIAYGKTSNLSPTQGVSISEPIRNSSVTPLIEKAYSGEKLMSSTGDKDQLYKMIQDSGISEYRMNEIWRKAQAGIGLDIPSPEHMKFYNLFDDIIKKNKLQRFNTGGYTGDNVPSSGGLAILDNKEYVLNEKQTSHIFDAVKLLDKVKSVLPNITRGNIEEKLAGTGNFNNTNNYELNVHIDNLNGDKTGAQTVVKEIMKGLKKLGRG